MKLTSLILLKPIRFFARKFDLKTLRSESGAPLMKCKEALDKFSDLDEALQFLREKNLILAQKKQNNESKVSILGMIDTGKSFIVSRINSETDFVSKNDDFLNFVEDSMKKLALNELKLTEGLVNPSKENLEEIKEKDRSLFDDQNQITARTQEKIEMSEIFKDTLKENEVLGVYIHKQLRENVGPSFAYVVLEQVGEGIENGKEKREDKGKDKEDEKREDKGLDKEIKNGEDKREDKGVENKDEKKVLKEKIKQVADDLAAHIFCELPEFINFEDIPRDIFSEKENEFRKEISEFHAKKPKDIQSKILSGKLAKEFDDSVLLKQKATFWDAEKTINDYLKEAEKKLNTKLKVTRFKIFKSS